ncbi:hypothetical protein LOZ12_003232 [Ophidiomyces ophidiicola]|uniref:Uncharacterized protein n=1 Tax=Ophidiomyces ophidiicola TaxID=1387563 RepID=A0ACB8UME2_9EURO|nr:hypothetical protein LOZ62_003217 [Ophidiomyces ophidiicola]KAI1971530.1 hypothetical protein LOZ56_002952 [Ophidiomyces ophidiicola]KAI2019340.1 hypothetical protein LOZ46_003422 [Ophidiomyces ophidiicola]KAI2050347.1 hypothetical protein LOZ38_003293 [Ophidiomyces ophidiicola]KAI2065044.1 hypothetical protein LOZ37_006427 [Ophidiomyces ophidiicola]
MTARIESVLAARKPSLTDENDWEEFALTDVKVRVPGKSRFANLLSASPKNPVTVTGLLELVESAQESLVLDDDYPTKRVIIENVTHYAYGQHDDGEVGIWVAGAPGWFAISPARAFRPIYSDMAEAVDLLYFLADKHRARGRKRKQLQPTMDHIFNQYVRHTHGACEDADDVEEVLEKHHAFLISQMLLGKENVDWAPTPIYRYFEEKHKELFEDSGAAEAASSPESENEEESDDDDEADKKAQADTIFEAILDMNESGRTYKGFMTLKTTAEYLMTRFEMDSLDYAINLMKARAGYLIQMMDNARSLSTVDWSRKRIYKQLKTIKPSTPLPDIRNTPLHPRSTNAQEDSPSSAEGSEEDELPRRRRAQMSILRPKLSSAPSKRTGGKSSKNPASESSSSDLEMDNMEKDDTPTKPGGHQLIQNSALIVMDTTATPSNPPTPEPNGVRSDASSNNILPARGDITTSLPPSKEPDTELPPDTWVCPALGCNKTIYKASSKRSKDAIFDHSLVHAEDTQTKLNLVVSEQRLNVNACVSHLLDKIRDFGSHQEGASESLLDEHDGHDSKRIKS